jgi:hypothetical protein
VYSVVASYGPWEAIHRQSVLASMPVKGNCSCDILHAIPIPMAKRIYPDEILEWATSSAVSSTAGSACRSNPCDDCRSEIVRKVVLRGGSVSYRA